MTLDPARREAVEARRRHARSLAAAAVDALAVLGVQAQAIGSLERPDFREDSDVDLLVDCGVDGYAEALGVCREAFGDFPVDVVPRREVDPDTVAAMVAEAAHAEPFASVGRRAEAVRGDVGVLTETMADLDVMGLSEGGVRTLANSADRTSRDLWVRLQRLLRRVALDADIHLPPDPDLTTLLAAAAGETPVVGAATVALLRDVRFAEAEEGWPASRLGRAAAVCQAMACMKAAEAVLADVDAFVTTQRARMARRSAPDDPDAPCRHP